MATPRPAGTAPPPRQAVSWSWSRALAGAVYALPAAVVALVGTGFCGALTTYSTFSYETLRLIEQKAYFYAVAAVAVTMIAGLGAAMIGYTTVHAIAG